MSTIEWLYKIPERTSKIPENAGFGPIFGTIYVKSKYHIFYGYDGYYGNFLKHDGKSVKYAKTFSRLRSFISPIDSTHAYSIWPQTRRESSSQVPLTSKKTAKCKSNVVMTRHMSLI